MIFWMLMLFFSGYMAAVHINALAKAPDMMSGASLGIFGIIGIFSALACYRASRANAAHDDNWGKIVDQFVRAWDRVSQKFSSGRWILTVVSAVAFGYFCIVIGKILITLAAKLPDTTVVALFMFMANILQNVFKDYFNMDRDDSGNGNGNGNGKPPEGPQGAQGIPPVESRTMR